MPHFRQPQRKSRPQLNRTETPPYNNYCAKTNVLPHRYHSRPANLIWRSGVGQQGTEGRGSHHWTGTIRKRVPEIIDLRNGRGLGWLCWNVSRCARKLPLVNT
ncbi:hypothetical protein CDAR_212111 [Caerostris darwini]|uniref:Uncharacterized protein n=1 Tax=Caerostris darwini TaxID=1538125 RepID=A0AAV4NRG8_9ARAC|nr:hypothetical protein CDAR_212111 [Caerostris darwini]